MGIKNSFTAWILLGFSASALAVAPVRASDVSAPPLPSASRTHKLCRGALSTPLLWELVLAQTLAPGVASELVLEQAIADLPPLTLSEFSTVDERWMTVQNFPIRSLIANPGHRVIRRPEAVDDIAHHIALGDFPIDLTDKGPAVNVITDRQGRVTSIDLWEGHHRMLGQIVAGRDRLGAFSKEELKIYVNGTRALDFLGASRAHIVPAFGVDLLHSWAWIPLDDAEGPDEGKTYRTRPAGTEGKNKDIVVNGRNSNYLLGARETLGNVLENIKREEQERVRIYFLSGGEALPSFETLSNLGITDGTIVFVRKDHQIEAHESLAILNLQSRLTRMRSALRVNLYAGVDVAEFCRKHGEKSFLNRIQQMFATTHEVTVVYPVPTPTP